MRACARARRWGIRAAVRRQAVHHSRHDHRLRPPSRARTADANCRVRWHVLVRDCAERGTPSGLDNHHHTWLWLGNWGGGASRPNLLEILGTTPTSLSCWTARRALLYPEAWLKRTALLSATPDQHPSPAHEHDKTRTLTPTHTHTHHDNTSHTKHWWLADAPADSTT